MQPDPLFEMSDEKGVVRTVRIVRNYIDGFGAEQFRVAVADVSDVSTGEEIMKVPLSTLVPRDEAHRTH